jgi:hypothetical protein
MTYFLRVWYDQNKKIFLLLFFSAADFFATVQLSRGGNLLLKRAYIPKTLRYQSFFRWGYEELYRRYFCFKCQDFTQTWSSCAKSITCAKNITCFYFTAKRVLIYWHLKSKRSVFRGMFCRLAAEAVNDFCHFWMIFW